VRIQNIASIFILLFFISAIILPQFAEARAGGGRSSMGSRGSRTYAPSSSYRAPSYQAKPIERSATTKPAPQTAPSALAGQPMNNPQGGFGGGTFWRGMAGGFLGAGIASMLFGGHAGGMGGGFGGGAGGMLGGLLQMLLIGGVLYFLYKKFFAQKINSNNNSYSNNSYVNEAEPVIDVTQPLLITDTDKQYFEQLLLKIQKSWSDGDLSHLRAYVTPEMLQYFNEELSANASRGLANKVEQVELQTADIMESWSEYNLDYVTTRLHWSALDYMVRLDAKAGDANYIASGNNNAVEEAEEFWTFVRAAGGNWLLSAIQQG